MCSAEGCVTSRVTLEGGADLVVFDSDLLGLCRLLGGQPLANVRRTIFASRDLKSGSI